MLVNRRQRLGCERLCRQDAGRVARVHARLLDVLHHRGDVGVGAVAQRVDVDLDRVLEEAVDERRALHARERLAHLVVVVAHAHRAAAEDVRRPHEHRVADPLAARSTACAPLAAIPHSGHAIPSSRSTPPNRSRSSARSTASNGVPRMRKPAASSVARELQRRLAAELDHDAVGLLALAHREHAGGVERLEVEAVGRVVVGRDGLRVAIDHHRLVAERPERLNGVDAAVVELDPLPDPVRPRAEDDHTLRVACRRRLVLLAPGRVVVVRPRLDLARARVDAPVDGPLDLLARLLGGERRRARAGTTGGGSRDASRTALRGRGSP